MSQYLLDEIEAKENIDLNCRRRSWAEVETAGSSELVLDAAGAAERVSADALFILIGAEPNTAGCRRRSLVTSAGSCARGPASTCSRRPWRVCSPSVTSVQSRSSALLQP